MLEAVQIRKQPDRMASVTKMARDLAFLSLPAARAFNLQGAPYWQEEEKRREGKGREEKREEIHQ